MAHKIQLKDGNDVQLYPATGQIVVTTPSITQLPKTYSLNSVTEEHEVLCSQLSVPAAQGSDWTVDTFNGSFTISGTFVGTTGTTVTLVFHVPEDHTTLTTANEVVEEEQTQS